MERFWRTFAVTVLPRAQSHTLFAERDIDPEMVIAARFCSGLFGTQLLCATWLLFIYGVDLGVVTPIGMAGSLFTLYCIVGTGRSRSANGTQRRSIIFDLAQTLWTWSTKLSPRS